MNDQDRAEAFISRLVKAMPLPNRGAMANLPSPNIGRAVARHPKMQANIQAGRAKQGEAMMSERGQNRAMGHMASQHMAKEGIKPQQTSEQISRRVQQHIGSRKQRQQSGMDRYDQHLANTTTVPEL